ncbi:hypothetical protein COCON_G00154670 [Conger conger]|uniref:Tudor domain-containing protein n=1 Tax=Conger conger TaxID=82655 RepID=A0A9Q1D946_CONCO|nr:hypothetical protein COCON_G00154670 [Conger conger]
MANARNEQVFNRGVGKNEDAGIWDDTALIKAYDKAVASFKHALKDEEESVESPKESKLSKPGKKRKSNKKNRSRKRSNAIPAREWRVGEPCCAFWSVDGKVYPATITSINKEKGTCTVVYTRYGNKEEQNLEDLLSDSSEVEEDGAKMSDQVKEGESSTEETAILPRPQGPLSDRLNRGDLAALEPPPGWPPRMSFGPPMMPPPPPLGPDAVEDEEGLSCMLVSWYMSGYHTGYYMGLKRAREESGSGKRPDPR